MDSIKTSVTIDLPPAAIYDYLYDVANHAEFTDHYFKDFRLTREDSLGVGAGARYRVPAPLDRFSWADFVITETIAPRRIVARGRTAKFNRIRLVITYDIEASGGSTNLTQVTEFEEPKLPSDRLLNVFRYRWYKRNQRKALRRLRLILEEDRKRGARATVANGGPRKPASQFRL